ncbi:MAG: hypothetical protein IID18_09460 [Nitrospinae bacterium]|nr:hypothetical protein [Nitrospinota bacterium]
MEAIEIAVRRVYRLINEGRWEDVWLSYTPEFRERCPYGAFFSDHAPSFDGLVSDVIGFEVRTLDGLSASAVFDVRRVAGDGSVVEYAYILRLVKDRGEWLWDEGC